MRWLETHRHRGIDLVLMCQQYGQVTLGVNRLVEATTKFRRLDRFGLKNRYQASVRGNPEELDVIRMFSGKYEPKLYAYYSSYSSATVRETARGGSILKSPTLLVGVLGLVVAVGVVCVWGLALRGEAGHQRQPSRSSRLLLRCLRPKPLSRWRLCRSSVPSAVHPVRIQGGMTTIRGGEVEWLWVSEDGHLMTEDEIAGESGGTVSSRMVRGVRVLVGHGGDLWRHDDRSQRLRRAWRLRRSAERPASDSTVSMAPV